MFHRQVSIQPAELNPKFKILASGNQNPKNTLKTKESLVNRRIKDLFGINRAAKLSSIQQLPSLTPKGQDQPKINQNQADISGLKQKNLLTSMNTPAKNEASRGLLNKKPSQEYFITTTRGKKIDTSREDQTTCHVMETSASSKKHFLQFEYKKSQASYSPRSNIPGSERGVNKQKLKIISAVADGSTLRQKSNGSSKYSLTDLSETLRGPSSTKTPASQVFSILKDVKSMLGKSQLDWKKPVN